MSLTRGGDRTAGGGAITFVAGDLRDRTYCERVVTETVGRWGGVDILFNNAGIIPRGSILETSDDMWHAALDVNLTAMFYPCRAAIPAMKERGGGAIVDTSSVWGVYPGPGHIAYCTSKGAVASFTKSLGRDHAPDGIRVNAVCPHEINTPMLRSGFEHRGLDPQKAVEDLNRTVPLGHIADPKRSRTSWCSWLPTGPATSPARRSRSRAPSPWAADRKPKRGTAVQLDGKIALVTGGGRGIGRGIVDRFLEEGAQVAVVQRQSLDSALDGHQRVAHVQADLSVPSSIATAVEQAVERFGGVDVLVNNAGIMFERTISEIRLDEWDHMMAVNLRAPLFLVQAALPHLRERGGGSVINIGSI